MSSFAARLRLPRVWRNQVRSTAGSTIIPSADYPAVWTAPHFPGSFTDFGHAISVNSVSTNSSAEYRNHPSVESMRLQRVKEFNDFMLTPTKELIVNELQTFSEELVRNEYEGKSGNASRLLYGEKGIGKSNSLRLSVLAMAAIHPRKLIPIYVEYIGDSANFRTPSALISHALQLSFPNDSISGCLEELRRRDQFVFFIADEIDQLYISVKDESIRLKILSELAELGSQRSGRVFTIVCGAACTPMLISKNAVHDKMLRIEYPLVHNSQNLNVSKFSPMRPSRKISQIKEECAVIASHYRIISGCDVLYFLAGSNLRAIDKVMSVLKRSELPANLVEPLLELVKPPNLWDQRARKTLEENKNIAKALNDALVEKNYDILLAAYSNHENILTISWIEKLQYLNFEEIRKAAHKAGCEDYQLIINSMVDKGYYSADSDLENLEPGRPLDLLYVFPTYVNKSWKGKLWLALQGIAIEVGREAKKQLITEAIKLGVNAIVQQM